MKRTIEILKKFKTTIDSFECHETIVTGTAGFRNANNTNDFIQALKAKGLNFEIKILLGEEEARLTHLAQSEDFKKLEKPFMVLDIGGGSTEFIFDDGKEIKAHSLSFGAVSLTERFLHSDPPLDTEMKALENFISNQLLKLGNKTKIANIIATAGTPTTLSAICQGQKTYAAKKIHKTKLKTTDITNLMNRFQKLPLKDRAKIPCLPAKRADVIIAGSFILKSVIEFFDLNECWVSDLSLRHGVLLDRIKHTINRDKNPNHL